MKMLLNPIWRYSGRRPKFVILDYRLFLLMFILIFNPSLAKVLFILGVGLLLYFIEIKMGFTLEKIFRKLRVKIVGKYRPAMSERRKRR
jgi:hypothetical protein